MQIHTLGIDFGKITFHLVGPNTPGSAATLAFIAVDVEVTLASVDHTGAFGARRAAATQWNSLS